MNRRTEYRFSLSYDRELVAANPLGFVVEEFLGGWFKELEEKINRDYVASYNVPFHGSWNYFELEQFQNNAFFNQYHEVMQSLEALEKQLGERAGLRIQITKPECALTHVLIGQDKILLSPDCGHVGIRVPEGTVVASERWGDHRDRNVDSIAVFGEHSKMRYVAKQVRYALKQKGVTTIANSSMARFLHDLFHPTYENNQKYKFNMIMSDVYVLVLFKDGGAEIYGKDLGEIFENHNLIFLEREYTICGQHFPMLTGDRLV
ncbi:hypothetical protein AVT69_gp344 [Pseudomonas phage PhiPA3]|uniref:Uncharacterized protein 346 n=1 Tax=Pseudomonas phage PhiPA3 TaxID=998086 RepID=F8SJM9_BPPA3|nr:hypothetical protein AVT69_gp344 [Pseudomonas phage PhiPA3]AEH03769.1 hypothetical protein [Pseudomonas phage PhiPA3]